MGRDDWTDIAGRFKIPVPVMPAARIRADKPGDINQFTLRI